jgi:hypothetical protein
MICSPVPAARQPNLRSEVSTGSMGYSRSLAVVSIRARRSTSNQFSQMAAFGLVLGAMIRLRLDACSSESRFFSDKRHDPPSAKHSGPCRSSLCAQHDRVDERGHLKKSFSIASFPSLARSSFTLGPASPDLFVVVATISMARTRSADFHGAIGLGWTSNCSAS